MNSGIILWLEQLLINLLVAAVMLAAGWFCIEPITKLVGKALDSSVKKKRPLLTGLATQVVNKGLWIVLVVMVLSRLGVDVGPLIAGLGVTGFILGFAFQESLGNLASGLMIAINEPFRVGDFVEVAGLSGTVRDVGIMATELSTPDNKKVVIPNKSAWGSPITNYSALGQRRVDLSVGIAYGESIEKAVNVARQAVNSVEGVLPEPEARIAPVSFDDSQITICLRPWVKSENYWTVHAAVIAAVKSAFERENISIPFPQLDVHQV